MRLINVYALSGSARCTERENFYNTELPAFLYTAPSNTILGGDFNCVLNPADTTGPFQTSSTLSEIVSRLALVNTRTQDPYDPPINTSIPLKLHDWTAFMYPQT